ncbi:MAG: hypothetical protein PHQ90_08950 [Sulfuricurvum sp.]|uniref:hypothetical protein n=1 Tax=Sulfuricurvum sp. TaxID=2025608 RepID=UPI0026187D72|nr:hypothetical protein [Sulfuricurvum sp.]MDD2369417.1 hypothetical protein [Sulfuricurvum sp.]MDD2950913.1 hypothetical protein [Sulfuricurvum sp.]MDD5119369.1 hypothetical protein [Sulfuricurvum sp.]
MAGVSSKGSSQHVKIPEEWHVLILVAGTTDPINATEAAESRAVSYDFNDKEYKAGAKKYWDAKFYDEIVNLEKTNGNIILFPFHGWTGDNGIHNREVAGRYLINRLCGAEGEKPYYENKHRTMYFHLLGHSHGGNVVNEMTKQIARLGGAWPEKWKVKSLIYLSTPFFNEIHQAKISQSFFHKDAEVLNLRNDYDLTQRMLADFSIEALSSVLIKMDYTALNNAIDEFKKSLEPLKNFDFDVAKLGVEDKDDRWLHTDIRITYNYYDGKILYETLVKVLETLDIVLERVTDLINDLQDGSKFRISKKLQADMGNKLSDSKTIISPSTAKKIKANISELQTDCKASIPKLKHTINVNEPSKSNYLVTDLIKDLNLLKITKWLERFLSIDTTTLHSSDQNALWNIVYELLEQNIEKFDDTYAIPSPQLKGTFLEHKLTDLNVTSRDRYDSKTQKINYKMFIKRVEQIEKNYKASPNQHNLLDLVFLLIEQEVPLHKLLNFGYWKSWFTKGVFKNAKSDLGQIIAIFEKLDRNYLALSMTRNFGGTKSNDDCSVNEMKCGSVPYLLIESHSTSRRVLHKEVAEFINRLSSTKKVGK